MFDAATTVVPRGKLEVYNKKEKELYDLKHELIAAQIKLENCEKSLRTVKKTNTEHEKEIVRLETELKKHKI